MKKRTAWILVAAVAAVAIGAAAVGALALMLRGAEGGSWTSNNGYLYLNLHDEIPEQPPAELPSLFERRPAPLRVLVESLDRAAADPKVTAVVTGRSRRISSLTRRSTSATSSGVIALL